MTRVEMQISLFHLSQLCSMYLKLKLMVFNKTEIDLTLKTIK